MKGLKLFAIATSVVVLAATPVLSSGMKFKIHNDSSYIINGFYTVEGGETSANWMDFKLEHGDTANMKFNYDGPCDVEFIVGWEAEDGSTIMGDNTTIDICKANNIYFDGKDATYD